MGKRIIYALDEESMATLEEERIQEMLAELKVDRETYEEAMMELEIERMEREV